MCRFITQLKTSLKSLLHLTVSSLNLFKIEKVCHCSYKRGPYQTSQAISTLGPLIHKK